MTAVDVCFHYGVPPGEAEMSALSTAREVYGIRALRFDEKNKTIRVEFDATRLNESNVEALLRRAGLDLTGKVSLA
jgi:hypothetical protein